MSEWYVYMYLYLAPLTLSHINIESLEIQINFFLLFFVFFPFLFPFFFRRPLPFGFVVRLYRMHGFQIDRGQPRPVKITLLIHAVRFAVRERAGRFVDFGVSFVPVGPESSPSAAWGWVDEEASGVWGWVDEKARKIEGEKGRVSG